MGLFGKVREWLGSGDQPLHSAVVPADPREVFLREIWRAAQDVEGVETVERHESELALRVSLHDGGAHVLYLENLYAEMRELAPDERELRIRNFLSALEASTEFSWEEARQNLLPVVRSVTFGLALPDEAGGEDDGAIFVRRPVLPYLVESIAIDQPHVMSYVSREQAAAWNVPLETVRATALDNLARLGIVVEPYDRDSAYPIWHVAMEEEAYTASCLLLPGFLAGFRDKVDGSPIAAIPHRASLVITGDGCPESVARLAELAEREFRASPRDISPALYALDAAGRVAPYQPPADHPCAVAVRRGHALLAATEYHVQGELLRDQYERRGIDRFVADQSLVSRKARGPLSYCVWPEGVDGSLPVADLIVFAGGAEPDDWHFAVRWADANEVAGHLLREEPGLQPTRMSILGWPDAAGLAELRRREVTFDDA